MPSSQCVRRELRERRRREVDRVPRELRVRDVTLDALDGQRAGQRAAPAVLDHVAEPIDGGRLADDAIVDALARGGELLDHLDRPVDRRPFFVGGDEQRDRARRVRMRCDERLDGGDERGERGLHVGGAAAVQPAVALGRHERIRLPLRQRAGRHDVGVPGEADERARRSPAPPSVLDRVRRERLGAKAERGEARRHQLLAAGVVGRERPPRDQLARQRERFARKAVRRGRLDEVHAEDGTSRCSRVPKGRRRGARG